MKKLELWRRPAPDGSPTEATGAGAAAVATAGNVPMVAASRDGAADDDALQALRRAAMLQHEDTVPAAFYRSPSD